MPLMANLDNTQASSCAPHKPTSRSFFLSFSQANLLKLFVFLTSQLLEASSCLPHKPTSQSFLSSLPHKPTSWSFFLSSSQANLLKLLPVFLTSQPLEASSCLPHKLTSRSFFLCSSVLEWESLGARLQKCTEHVCLCAWPVSCNLVIKLVKSLATQITKKKGLVNQIG